MSQSQYTPRELQNRYLIQIQRMLYTALKIGNDRAVIALRNLLIRVGMHGLRRN